MSEKPVFEPGAPVDVLSRPDHYAEIVRDIRREFGQRHSPEVRLRELIRIVQE